MKIPPIDLSKLLRLLKSEGKAELKVTRTQSATIKAESNALSNPFHPLLMEWDNIIAILEREVIPLLGKGCDAKSLLAPAQKLSHCAVSISLMASQVLSFVPGPIGIVCSLINAIVCFSSGNIVGGLMELLGCVPGLKAAGKASSRLGPRIAGIIGDIFRSNRKLAKLVESSAKASDKMKDFCAKFSHEAKPLKADIGFEFGVRSPAQPVSMSQLPSQIYAPAIVAPKEIGKYTTFTNTYVNIRKPNLWPHLGY